ncbi:hypothetical protein L2E82_33612 [Cichorium intybus]|uniref:Uncharacterized protein n=1 Tax=Cichorium intybus TaxID=13427 RepID=A0ACB9BKR3_CICIN|nr:hypothetical protein L2E82_33612 [Cichorium intybus]
MTKSGGLPETNEFLPLKGPLSYRRVLTLKLQYTSKEVLCLSQLYKYGLSIKEHNLTMVVNLLRPSGCKLERKTSH